MLSPKAWGLDEKAAMYVLLMGEGMGWWGRRTLTGFTVNLKGNHWTFTVRCQHKGSHMVTFYSAGTYQGAIKSFAIDLARDAVKWRPDEYKKKI